MVLSDYLTPEMIDLQVSAVSWQAAIRASGQLLFSQQVCEEGYIKAMLDAVDEYGPYMVFAPGIALTHGRPEDGVLKTGLSLIRLTHPVLFGNGDQENVSIVISFAAFDHKQHIHLLTSLARLLIDNGRLNLIKEAKTEQEILEMIKKFEVQGGAH